MHGNHLLKIAFGIAIAVALNGAAVAKDYYFYTGLDYGSQGTYNPLSVILNGGFDIFQTRTDHEVFKYPYKTAFSNVIDNLGHADAVVKYYGGRNFFSEQIFPLTTDMKKWAWWPNYSLHLIGGGVEWAMLHEFFTYHNIPVPWLWGTLTYWSYHFLNEAVENGKYQGKSVDSIADIYIFDLLGQLLFSIPAVRKFFGGTLHMTDWSMLPTFVFPGAKLENTGQYFSLKLLIPIPKNEIAHLFAYYGLNVIVGLSFKLIDGYSLSFGAGARAKKVTQLASMRFTQSINYVYSGGIFLDRNDSLLASLIVNTNYYHLVQLNVYPGIFRMPHVALGFWINVSDRGKVMFGVMCRYIPGVGFREANYYPQKLF